MPGHAVDLDDHTRPDQEIDATHAGNPNLRHSRKTGARQSQPHERFRAGLGSGVESVEHLPSCPRRPLRQRCEIRDAQQPAEPSVLDYGGEVIPADAPGGVSESIAGEQRSTAI
ncbi:hypothetical protein [Microcella alkalica]|uniref:hypothetical protein n=1 Tax=Microcella alkalica TaxID=355930 RepID=UPI002004F09E|nr:hypothetical protein [Microcella alkalica]